ncbi:MAG: hypothetical protein ACM3TT_00380 [Syntrophothermus sp.]
MRLKGLPMGKIRFKLLTAILALLLVAAAATVAATAAAVTMAQGIPPWSGTDVIVEKFAEDLGGVQAREPFINTDQGDLLLFVFALGGFGAGFTAGYLWRILFAEKQGTVNV